MKHVGKLLNALIKQHKVKKKDLAEKVGITPIYLSRILSKHNASMPCETLERFCIALGEDPGQFFDYRSTASTSGKVDIHDLSATTIIGTSSVSAYGVYTMPSVTDKEKLLEELLRERERSLAAKDQLLNEKERLIKVLLGQLSSVASRRNVVAPEADSSALLTDV